MTDSAGETESVAVTEAAAESDSEGAAQAEPRSRSARRRKWIGVVLLLVVGAGLDAQQPPERQVLAHAALLSITAYQATLSKLMPMTGVQCRFEPTCSHYAAGSIRRHGLWVGSGKTARRLLRCGPWTEMGTVDPP